MTEFFPPVNSVASLRLYSFAKYWQCLNHEITVITTLKESKPFDLNLDISSFLVIQIPVPFLPQPSKKNTNKQSGNTIRVIVFKKILKPIYDFIRNKTGCFSQRFPTFCDLWVKKCLKELDPFSFDIVLSSGGPYSVHRVGFALKQKNPKIKWVVDWRDLWTKNPYAKGFLLFHSYEKYLEKRFHDNADLISTVSDPLNGTLAKMTKTPVKTVYNGFDADNFKEICKTERKRTDFYTIVYTGSLYLQLQNPSPFFAAISRIKDMDRTLFDKVRIQFVGMNADVKYFAKKYNVLEAYSFSGFLAHDEALKMQYNADAVLFMDYNGTNGLPSGKLFEYINTARKIIAIGNNPSSLAVEIIKKTNTGIFLGENIDLITEYLVSCINNTNKDIYEKNYEIINGYSRENQANRLFNYIQETL